MNDAIPDSNAAPGSRGEIRCPCGALLLRSVPEGIEVKCRRCKRANVITWAELGGTAGGPACPPIESCRPCASREDAPALPPNDRRDGEA